jgi:hypothetical protein
LNLLRCAYALVLSAACLLAGPSRSHAFDLQYNINNSSGQFDANEVQLLNAALGQSERMWETVIRGYQPGINIGTVPISVNATTSGLAAANFSGTTFQGGFWLATSGFININVNEIENFTNWQGPGANGLNFLDELLAHETGHVLGVGTLWDDNQLYVSNTFHYTGQHGLAAYKGEFDPAAMWVPVENAGNPGTPNSHWDQLMRSSPQEGNPADPWSLDPRVGVVDSMGRDRAFELMTGAIDPDWLEPFVSRFGVESMRDLGYTVAAFEDFNSDGLIDLADRNIVLANMGATGLQVDSIAFGDANRDRKVDAIDLQLWRTAAGVPEPSAIVMSLVAGLALRRRRTI